MIWPPLIPDPVADAIRDRVLPPALRVYPTLLRLCPCQYGACQHCAAGRHGACTTARNGAAPSPHARITDARGLVPNDRIGRVWTVGRPCAWVCQCPTCAHPRPQLDEVGAPGNPPARHRTTTEALTLF